MKVRSLFAVLSMVALSWVTHALAADVYVAQSTQGADTGADADNAHSLAWLNDANQVSAGTIVHLCGTITNSITIQTSGSSDNPITFVFEPNARFSAPTWSGNIITISANNVTIDGGVNGIIEATDNGTGLTYSKNFSAIFAANANNFTVKNLTIRNLYVRTRGGEQNGYCRAIVNDPSAPPYGYTNFLVTNCIIHDCYIGVSANYGFGGSTNTTVANCVITNINWGVQVGDVTAGSKFDDVYISGNTIGSFAMWDDTAMNSFHHNAIYCWGTQSGSKMNNLTISGNTVFGYGVNNTSGFYFSADGGVTIGGKVVVCNNIFNDQSGNPSNGHIYFLPVQGFIGIVANNDVFGNGWGTLLDWDAGNDGHAGPQNVYLYNSVVSNSMALAVYRYSAGLHTDYNAVGKLPNLGGWFSISTNSSASVVTLSTWSTWGLGDTHSIASTLNLDSSLTPLVNNALIGSGTNLTSLGIPALNVDYAGNARPATGAWTIGMYQSEVAVPIVPPRSLRPSTIVTNGL